MKITHIEIRNDAPVASADELVRVRAVGFQTMRTGFFDAVPQPDRGTTRA